MKNSEHFVELVKQHRVHNTDVESLLTNVPIHHPTSTSAVRIFRIPNRISKTASQLLTLIANVFVEAFKEETYMTSEKKLVGTVKVERDNDRLFHEMNRNKTHFDSSSYQLPSSTTKVTRLLRKADVLLRAKSRKYNM